MSDGKFFRSRRDALGLVFFTALCLVVAGIGGAVTASSVDTWYANLIKPPFNPPNWVFAPVWTTLYVLMAVGAWRVWRLPLDRTRRNALTIFAVQLALNLMWSVVFFGFRQAGLALIDIFALLLVIIVNTVFFWRADRLAGGLFVPYLLWVAFASVLNASLWLLN